MLVKPTELKYHKLAYQLHEVCSIGYFFKCSFDDSLSYYKSKRDKNACRWFISELRSIINFVEPYFKQNISMKLSDAENDHFSATNICHICEQMINTDDIKIHDHCHFTGKYRGPAQ